MSKPEDWDEVEHDEQPETCPRCSAELESSSGYAGEEILFCTNGCGVVWEDSASIESLIR